MAFANIISECQQQALDDQWRMLSHATLPFDSDGMEPEEFRGRLKKITDGIGIAKFDLLCDFMQSLLCLRHPNVDVKKSVFVIQLNQNQEQKSITNCNCQRALIKVKNGVKLSGGCIKFSPPLGAKQRMSSSSLYADKNNEDSTDSN